MLAREMAQIHGAYLVEDSLALPTCEAATIGLELVRDNPKLEVVLVALGGGAMASGVGCVLRSLADQVEVIGIQPVGAPAMALLAAGNRPRDRPYRHDRRQRCRPLPDSRSAGRLARGARRRGACQRGLDQGRHARALYEQAGLVVEPSAALGVAAVVEHHERFAGRRITTIPCGSNVAAADFAQWVLEPAARDSR
jgi:threonine dehydratase